MSQSRYRQARTLVRRPCRLPGEASAGYKSKVGRLREHFERFNVDVSELCQWLMGLRKGRADATDPAYFGVLGNFMLEPTLDRVDADEAERDRWRRTVFDDVAGFRSVNTSMDRPIPDALREAIKQEAERLKAAVESTKGPAARHSTITRLLDRLRALEPAHRLVLLKSAAEWIVARYRRGVENWIRQRKEWEKEKRDWEAKHPALTVAVRQRYTDVFKNLVEHQVSAGAADPDTKQGLRRKRPRICPYERLKPNINNCAYAGQKGHGPLCWRYAEFVKARKEKFPKFDVKMFAKDAEKYIPRRARGEQRHIILKALFPNKPVEQQRFSANWDAYLAFSRKPVPGGTSGFDPLTESTALENGRLPHCGKIGETYEKSTCEWNPHTELCLQYKRALLNPANGFDDPTLALEPLYRQWRRAYLAGPRKPSFKYPSSRELPMPKIFGSGFHEIDFDRCIVRLRLDDMPLGQWLELGFTPWPRDYKPSRDEIKIPGRVTSVHVHFVGARARIGFRFDAPHKESRFDCTQDELDELRSRVFPRQAQDRQFLEAARKLLLESFNQGGTGVPPVSAAGGADPLRLLAVDLGESGACAAFYQGRKHEKDAPLAIVKINKLYTDRPKSLEPDSHGRPEEAKRKFEKDDPRGVRKEHVGRHLARIAEQTAEITKHPTRQRPVPTTVTAGPHDLRGLKRHVAWMIRDWARHNASQIVKAAEDHRCDLIVFESMRGQKVPGYDRLDDKSQRDKRQLAFLANGRVRRKVVEKAVERGMRVVTVPYFKSSQFCSACGGEQKNKGLLRKNKKERKFKCEHRNCGAELNSDANAAQVLARVFWGEIVLPPPDVMYS